MGYPTRSVFTAEQDEFRATVPRFLENIVGQEIWTAAGRSRRADRKAAAEIGILGIEVPDDSRPPGSDTDGTAPWSPRDPGARAGDRGLHVRPTSACPTCCISRSSAQQ